MASSRPNSPPPNSPPTSPAVSSPLLIHSGTSAVANVTTQPTTISPANTPPSSPSRQPTQPVSASTPVPRRTSTVNTFATTQSQPDPANSARPTYRRGRSSAKNYYDRLQKAFSPSTHDLEKYSAVRLQGTSRPYLHHQQRHRLWRKTIGEFGITLLLCLTYWAILFGYHFSTGLTKSNRRWFNALVTANALVLGVNLSNSLRSYAKMLRWRMLASTYRSLVKFDLILGCDSLWNVVKLLKHERSPKNWLPINTMAQVYCLMWLIVQAGIALCVGIIGLTYNLDVSSTIVFTQTGNTSVINLPTLSSGAWLNDLAAINTWGVRGDYTDAYESPDLLYSDFGGSGSYLTTDQGHTRYYFVDIAADDQTETDVSYRYIDATASCISFPVTAGTYGNSSQITYISGGEAVNQTIFAQPGVGGLYVQGDTNATCGDACASVVAFQAAVPPDQADAYDVPPYYVVIPHATRFECNCSVTNVKDTYSIDNDDLAGSEYQISPLIRRMLAGAYGWSDNPLKEDRYLYGTYTASNELSFTTIPTALEFSNTISTFTMQGIVAMDSQAGLPRQYIADGSQPIPAQILHVKWWAAGTLLAIIPFIQFWTMLVVIALANKTIIKDDANISVARVYHSLLGRLEGRGCILDGDQLIEALGNPRVAYAYSEGSSSMKHVDVYEENSQIRLDRCFPEGNYDGASKAHLGDHAQLRGNIVDAYKYF